jgi:hypothetical protein
MAGLRNVGVRLEDVLQAVKDRVAAAVPLPAEYVYLSLDGDDEAAFDPPNDLFCAVRPGAYPMWPGAVAGGGNVVPWFDGELDVSLWSRLALDLAVRDDAYLQDRTLGALAKFRLLVKALQLFDPTNAAGDFLLVEPMRLAPPGFEARRPRAAGRAAGWGRVWSRWEIKFLMDLS